MQKLYISLIVHFGDPTFSDSLKFNILSQIQDKNPDMIIFAGDLTYSGHINEYDNANEFIKEYKKLCANY
jgi:3',5'-cyclic-AMP phosphodiesterase